MILGGTRLELSTNDGCVHRVYRFLPVALNRDGFVAVVVVFIVSSLPLRRGHGMQ